MSASFWTPSASAAHLSAHGLTAQLAWREPQQGLRDIGLRGTPWPEAAILGLRAPIGESADAAAVRAEAYPRGADWVAVYEDPDGHAGRVDALWRALGPLSDSMLGGVELIVSVRSYRWETQPEVAVVGRLPPGDVFRLTAEGGLQKLHGGARDPATDGEARFSCTAVSCSAMDAVYLELAHPADRPRDCLKIDASRPEGLEIEHRLFAEPLEKGVILRARVRGLFLTREGDLAARAAALYEAFRASDPPLGA